MKSVRSYACKNKLMRQEYFIWITIKQNIIHNLLSYLEVMKTLGMNEWDTSKKKRDKKKQVNKCGSEWEITATNKD